MTGDGSRKIIIVGCDRDLIFDSQHLKGQVLGYTSPSKKDEVPYEYLGDIRNIKSLPPKCDLFVTVDDAELRLWILRHYGDRLFTYISPRATVSDNATLGPGVVVQSHAYVSDFVSLGALAKINVGVTLIHHTTVGICSILAPNVTLLGHSKIGDTSFVGAGSIVREKLSVGKGCLIGMGSVVVKSISDGVLAYGNPCKVQKKLMV